MTPPIVEGVLADRPGYAARVASTISLEPRLRWRLTQVVADFLTVSLSGMAAYGLYLATGIGQQHMEPLLYVQMSIVLAAITVFSFHGQGAYRDPMGLLRVESMRCVVPAVVNGVLLTLALSFLTRMTFSRLTVVLLAPTIMLALVAQRFFVSWCHKRSRKVRPVESSVLVYGAGAAGRLLAQHLIEDHLLGLEPVGFLDDDPELRGIRIKIGAGVDGQRIPVLGDESKLQYAMAGTGATAVFIAMPSASSDRVTQIALKLEGHGIPCFFVPSAGRLFFSDMQMGQVAGMPILTRRRAKESRIYQFVKRLIDIVGATLTLIVTLPVIAVAAVLIWCSSRGPIFFKQERVGRAGARFTMFKLRTMAVDSPKYALHPNDAQDSRVTAVGRLLRRLSIDELPQLWNVLRGEMSLVGPRPEMPFVVKRYDEVQRRRLAVKPGATGLWQVSADRAFSIHENMQYDLYYVGKCSLSLDLAILLMTPFALLARNRAV
jgi:putative colanic acid biosynthesis UDP-glucose lipid carrier transferase